MPTGAVAGSERFLARLPFPPDPFQLQAIDALDAGRSVLVAAPTGSGKTVVAEYAVDLALAVGAKTFYTAPDQGAVEPEVRRPPSAPRDRPGRPAHRRQRHQRRRPGGGDDHRGAAQHDLRVGRRRCAGLRYVVLDEVHYLQDHYRGPVWEEVIIHAAARVGLVCLSATVSNAEELAEWISTVRGPCDAVIEERRPTRLENLYLVGDKGSPTLHLLPTLVDGRPNPEATASTPSRCERGPDRGHLRGRSRRRYFTPNRLEVLDRLADDDLLPAIVFIFSRAACDDAVRSCLDAGVALTTPEERQRIRSIVEQPTARLADADLRCWATPGGWRASRPAWPPTTPAWSRRSRRRSRRASPRGW